MREREKERERERERERWFYYSISNNAMRCVRMCVPFVLVTVDAYSAPMSILYS
jgi:hypothetical protein